VAGGAMRAVIELAGIKDVVAKSLGASNKLNVAKATIKALSRLNQDMVTEKTEKKNKKKEEKKDSNDKKVASEKKSVKVAKSKQKEKDVKK